MVSYSGVSSFIRGQIEPNEDGSVSAPDNIIPSLPAAFQQYTSLRNSHIDRIATYAAILGMVSGNPPYDQAELDAAGLGHIANFNNYKGRSAYEKSAQGYWNLINSTEVYVKVVLAGKYPDIVKYANTIARNFSDVTKEWEDFDTNFNLIGSQLTLYGYCPVFFPHEESPLWEVVDVARFYIPPQSQTFPSKLTSVAIDTIYTVQDLWNLYEDEDATRWSKEALAQFLLYRANANFSVMLNNVPLANMVDLERFINNADVGVGMGYFSDSIRLVNIYQKEYDGKVSHYIFSAEMYMSTGYAPEKGEQDFLYFYDRQYKQMSDAIVIFTASPGEWTIHGNMGVSQKMYAPATAVNMLDCTVVDMSKMSATPLIRTLATGGRDMSAIRFYPGVPTDIGAAEFQQNDLGKNINQLLQASAYLTGGIDANTVNSGEDPGFSDRAQGSVSASEDRNRTIKEFGVLRNVVAHFYKKFDEVNLITFIRFLTCPEGAPGYEYAKEFKERCLMDGVPDWLFDTAKKGLKGLPKQFKSIKSTRVAGDGSTLARRMGLQDLGKISPMFNSKEIGFFKKEWVSATVGVDYIPEFASSDDQNDENIGGVSLARTEDNLMELGKEALFSPDNDQVAHGDEHMGTGSKIVQMVAQQQMSPVDADKIISLLVPHLEQHIKFMSNAPDFYGKALGELEGPYRQLKQWAQLNRKNALAMIEAAKKKQAEDAAKTQQVMDDKARKDFTARADAERKATDAEVDNARKDKNQQATQSLKERQTDADIANKEKKAAADIQVKQATAKGATQVELDAESGEQLSERISNIIGDTPSSVDFS